MKRESTKAVQLSSKEIAESIAALEAKLAEAQEAVKQAEATCGRDWQSLLAGGENRLREQLTVARDRADALMLALNAAREDLESARQRERREARLARRGELLAVIEQRGQAADAIAAAVDSLAGALLSYFDGVRRARSITGKLASRTTAEGTLVTGFEVTEHFDHLQTLTQIALRERLAGLWRFDEAVDAQVRPIDVELRALGDRIVEEFDARYGDTATEDPPAA